MAAGMSLPKENLQPFRDFLNAHSGLKDEDLLRKIWIDVPMPLSYITMDLIGELESLSPFGNGFERPLFADRSLYINQTWVVGRNKNALKISLRDTAGRDYSGIMFGDAPKYAADITKRKISILYVPTINDFNGKRTIQLQIQDYLVEGT